MSATVTDLALAVHAAVSRVDDPEYPGVSIVDLGLLEQLDIADDGSVQVGLIPTFSGCPALAMIATDVTNAVESVPGVGPVHVRWLASPPWTIDRISADAKHVLAEQFTVAVQIGTKPPSCPRCGAPTTEHSMFGPSRCRAVHRCSVCSETVEVMRA